MVDTLAALFAKVGTVEHPNGALLLTYRNHRRLFRQALRDYGLLGPIPEVLAGFRRSVQNEVFQLLVSAEDLGKQAFRKQLDTYGAYIPERSASGFVVPALNAIMTQVDRQITIVNSMLATGASEEELVGDLEGERLGILQPAPVARDASHWIVEVASLAFLAMLGSGEAVIGSRPVQFSKQAVAGLDERTTDCCLRVHGQVQPIGEKFKLTGTPRYADEMDHSPFHYRCRTSIVLYLAEYDDGLTARMRESADRIMQERARGGSGYRHPADAFS